MKFVFSMILVFGLFWSNAQAENFKLDSAHSDMLFKIKHLVVATVTGRFGKFDASFQFDRKTKKLSDVSVSVDVSSIDTNHKKRDKHLRNADFFEVKKYPKAVFKSQKVIYSKGKPSKLKGVLTIRDKTRPIVMDLDYKGIVKDAWGKDKLVFEAETEFNRKDFGISWNKTLDKGGLALGETVKVLISGQAAIAP